MRMARGRHVRPRLVHSAMNQEPRRVRRQAHVAPDRLAVIVDEDHVARFQQPEVLRQRVRPESVRVLRVAHGDVARHAFRVALAGEDAEGEGHFGQHPLPVRGVGGVRGDAGEGLALGDELEGGFGGVGFLVGGGVGVFLVLGLGFGGDGGLFEDGDC